MVTLTRYRVRVTDRRGKVSIFGGDQGYDEKQAQTVEQEFRKYLGVQTEMVRVRNR